ncbi:Peptide chain release factor 2 [Serratia fonticola]|uniref:Peptide chain release factor 2 n=2 Tax=Enterobacterales TaxID=91347 RepID=A0A4U9VGB1_SERFO|nr:Peptide chain release factor 2 [Serratia fonticola]
MCPSGQPFSGGIFDYDAKKERLEEVNAELEQPDVWNEPERAQALGKERSSLEAIVETIDQLEQGCEDVTGLLELAVEAEDEDTFNETVVELDQLSAKLEQLEFRRMFSGEYDSADCYLDIQAGSGGTEAQDWASMLLRMYLRWAESKGFKTEVIEESDGDVAGLKSATIKIIGDYAFGWLRTETGVHRLVRKSPFDSGGRRHTSFSSVFIYPEVDDDIDIEINPADLRIDVYRASGAGGQHVNKTESAVRITHLPTNIVVQCQNDRSQHKNKDQAFKQLRAKLYEYEMQKKNADKQMLEDNKSDIGWGSQIRSYVLDDSRIKDLRTNVETRNTQAVLDGDLDKFIEASLKAGYEEQKCLSNKHKAPNRRWISTTSCSHAVKNWPRCARTALRSRTTSVVIPPPTSCMPNTAAKKTKSWNHWVSK